MTGLIKLKQVEREFETYRSGNTNYVNGTTVAFTHGWSNFDPATHWHSIQAWAICTQAQAGWTVGERALLNGRRCTISMTSTDINVQIGANGINISRKNGNLNEVNLNSSRWLLYVMGVRKI